MAEDRDLTPAQRAGLDKHEADQDRTLAAMHRLEAALGAASPGREPAWRDDVLGALVVLEGVTSEEYEDAERPDSLLSDIKRNQPRLRNRVRGLRLQYAHLRDAIAALRRELEEATLTDVADMRERLAWLLTAMRHQRARDSDLIYEAYFDAFRADLAVPSVINTPAMDTLVPTTKARRWRTSSTAIPPCSKPPCSASRERSTRSRTNLVPATSSTNDCGLERLSGPRDKEFGVALKEHA